MDVFGRKLNRIKFLDCYLKAISELCGHLLTDFDPKTSDSLRPCPSKTSPAPTALSLPPYYPKKHHLELNAKKWHILKKSQKGEKKIRKLWNRVMTIQLNSFADMD